MKNYKLISVLCVLWLSVLTVGAQTGKAGFTSLSWDEASAEAARANKIILVDVMRPMKDAKMQQQRVNNEKKLFSSPGVADFLNKHVIAIRMDMSTEAGMAFAPKLQMNMYPTYGFFMPDGDLLKVISPYTLMQKPELFLQTTETAWSMAEGKRANTRSIQFTDVDLKDALTEAKKDGKLIFIDAYTDPCQPCIMMAKNIFTLDKVADFYNSNFINLKINFGNIRKDLAEKYGTSGYPAFVFVNGDGKLVYKAGGYSDADKFIGYGEEALKKAKGIEFFEGAWSEAVGKARQENKLVFIDCQTSWCGPCKQMAKNVFTDPDVAAFFNEKFVNVKMDMEKGEGKTLKDKYAVSAYPTLNFIDGEGNIVHSVVGGLDANVFLAEAQKALNGEGLTALKAKYQQGNREPEFIQDYLIVLDNANLKKETETVCLDYFASLDKNKLKEKKYWDLFEKYVNDANSDVFQYVYDNRTEFCTILGEKEVMNKIKTVWTVGANQFIRTDGEKPVLDVKGFNKYVKRMEKSKVEGRDEIVSGARMINAEKLGDWKTYIALGNEKIKAGKVPDLVLYNWGLRINKQCKDQALRLQAAKWFDDAAVKAAKMEGGKANMMSYKTYFERIAKDLKTVEKL